ncbi:MAG: DUF4112 domain-containing protein [Pseudohongiellaceae bacterium]
MPHGRSDPAPDDGGSTDENEQLKRRDWLAWLLDSSVPIPGGYRIGLDGIIGLVPGIGDAIGGGLSTWIIYQAYKRNVRRMVLARMVINVIIDGSVGAIPIIGDLFDFFWKANLRNSRLMERYNRNPESTYKRSVISNFLFFLGIVVVVVLLIYAVIALLQLVWSVLFGS